MLGVILLYIIFFATSIGCCLLPIITDEKIGGRGSGIIAAFIGLILLKLVKALGSPTVLLHFNDYILIYLFTALLAKPIILAGLYIRIAYLKRKYKRRY